MERIAVQDHKTPVDFPSVCTRALAELRPNSTYLAVHQYMNNFGELSNFSIVFHVDYHNAIRRSKRLLEGFAPDIIHCLNKPWTLDDLKRAQFEIISSFEDTLKGDNPRATAAKAYNPIVDPYGNRFGIKGIKLHRDQDILHLWGFVVHKVVLMPGNYPPEQKSSKTAAKDYLRSLLPVGNFRQYKLTPGKFFNLTVERITITEEDVIREHTSKIVKKGWA